MSENCTHNCGTCSANCGSRTSEPQSFLEKLNPASSVKKVIGVVSGKGGVGKSTVTSLLSVMTAKKGFKTAVLDADITGPSIPKMLGINERAMADDNGIYPGVSKSGVRAMSLNMLVEDETTPVIWRGPVIAGTVKQFWTDVIWGDIDCMYIDMPPGTGDIPLTVFQSIPVDGIIIVTSPQDLVSMIVDKAVNMAEKMDIPVIGLVENYSYFRCPDCGKEHHIFGESSIASIAEKHGLPVLARLPIDPHLAELCDAGRVDEYETTALDKALSELLGEKTE